MKLTEEELKDLDMIRRHFNSGDRSYFGSVAHDVLDRIIKGQEKGSATECENCGETTEKISMGEICEECLY